MIKRVILLVLGLSYMQAMAAAPEEDWRKPDGSISLPGVRSLTPEDAELWRQIMERRAQMPTEMQAMFPFGTHKFHSETAEARKTAGVRYHAVALTPDGQDPSLTTTMFSAVGVFPRHGYNEKLYPEIIDSLARLGVTGDAASGIAIFVPFMDPSITPEALVQNINTLVRLVQKLREAGEKLPEERSQASADVKIRVVPNYLVTLIHLTHPLAGVLETLEFLRLKDGERRDSHVLDIYIDGPVNSVITTIAKKHSGITDDKEAKAALKTAISTGAITPDSLRVEITEYLKNQRDILPWRSTFVLPLTPEAKGPLEALATHLVSTTEYGDHGVSDIAIAVAMRKLTEEIEY